MIHEGVNRYLDEVLVSRQYTKNRFVDLFTSSIPESDTTIASQIYDSYEKNDLHIIEKVQLLVDTKLSSIEASLVREQVEDSVSLGQLNKQLHDIDEILEQYLNQLNIDLETKNAKMFDYVTQINAVEPVDASLRANVIKLIRGIEANENTG
ncbi:unnamed protein product [Kluyveromyces dobzhanskii CBS 2104]|uniref:WGS project CCBQ000000000 data, contig 00009 n=1 Tax=Kluyveromyces dobzhanskii CBS 2104 TaxID=1427455 RepID=A0A0A8L3B6_9SACH|nr:unnamed protein product [Kluyveromyces dobzhanskii CBS 2104]